MKLTILQILKIFSGFCCGVGICFALVSSRFIIGHGISSNYEILEPYWQYLFAGVILLLFGLMSGFIYELKQRRN